MAKFLLFVAVIAFVYAVVRHGQRRRPPPPQSGSGEMVQCARCGVYFPRQESLSDDGGHYCCDEHRRLGPRQ